MNDDQAQVHAIELYGKSAYAKRKKQNDVCIGINGPYPQGWDVKKMGPLKTLLGWGATWEDAFSLAATRATWHTHLLPQYEQGILL